MKQSSNPNMGKVRRNIICSICGLVVDRITKLLKHKQDIHFCRCCNQLHYDNIKHDCISPELVGAGATTQDEANDSGLEPTFFKKLGGYKNQILCNYHYDFSVQFDSARVATDSILNHIRELLSFKLSVHASVKFKLVFKLKLERLQTGEIEERQYFSDLIKVTDKHFITEAIKAGAAEVDGLSHLMSESISGLRVRNVASICIKIHSYKPVVAKGFIPAFNLGPLARKNGLINPHSTSSCFESALLIALCGPSFTLENGKTFANCNQKERRRLRRWLVKERTIKEFKTQSNLQHLDLPVGSDLTNISIVEETNQISISVFAHSTLDDIIIPIRLPEKNYKRKVGLLLVKKEDLPFEKQHPLLPELHFCAIIDTKMFFRVGLNHYKDFCLLCAKYQNDEEHEKDCMNTSNSITLPATDRFSITELDRVMDAPRMFVASFMYFNSSKTPTESFKGTICGFTLIGVQANHDIDFCETYYGADAVEIFVYKLRKNTLRYLNDIEDQRLPLQSFAKDKENIQKTKHCPLCSKEFTAKNPKTRHHIHIQAPSAAPPTENIIICSRCNLKAKYKPAISCFVYDLDKCAWEILEEAAAATATVNIIKCSDSSAVRCVDIDKCRILDGRSHFGAPLHNVFQEQPASAFEPFKKFLGNDEKKFAVLSKPLVFPHWETRSLKQLESSTADDYIDLHDIHDLQNNLNLKHTFKDSYLALQCNNMLEYAKASTLSNAFNLCCSLLYYNKWTQEHFKLSCLNDISLASFSYFALHFLCKSSYQNLRNESMIRDIQEGMIGGLSLSSVKYARGHSESLGDQNLAPDDESSLCFLDYNSEYLYILGTEPLAYESYNMLSEVELESFDPFSSGNSDERFLVCCDMTYPASLRKSTRHLPLVPTRTTNVVYDFNGKKIAEIKRNELNLLDKEKVWLNIENLRLYVSLGMILTKIHRVYKYTVKVQFQEFMDVLTKARNNAPSNLYATLAKQISVFACGSFGRRTENIRSVVITDPKKAEKHLAMSNLFDADILSEDAIIVYKKRQRPSTTRNLLILFDIYQKSHRMIYSMYYQTLLPHFGPERLSLLLVQTDSFALVCRRRHSSGKSFFEELKELQPLCDFSKVSADVPELFSTENARVPGKLKVEALHIRSFVSLRANVYSYISLSPSQCLLHAQRFCEFCATQVNKGASDNKLLHDQYLAVLQGKAKGTYEYEREQRQEMETKIIPAKRTLTCSDNETFCTTTFERIPPGLEDQEMQL